MTAIWLALATYLLQWVLLPFVSDEWVFLLGMSCLEVALSATGVALLCKDKPLILRYAIVVWSICAWGDVAKFLLWNISDLRLDLSVPTFLAAGVWFLHIAYRRYDTTSATIHPSQVYVLLKRPTSTWDLVKSMLGSPAASVCICINDSVWAFRRKTGMFEKFALTKTFLDSHVAVSTGQTADVRMTSRLDYLVGTPRGIVPCKCVWRIRDVLNTIGGKFAIKTWLDYVPSFYAMRIL